jgi:hypothetical protein
MKNAIMNWFVCWAYLIDGIIGVLSFGLINTHLVFNVSSWYLDNVD